MTVHFTPIQAVYVMPSTSGRAATFPRRADKLKFFSELKELRDRLKKERELQVAGASQQVISTSQTGSGAGQTSTAEPVQPSTSQYTSVIQPPRTVQQKSACETVPTVPAPSLQNPTSHTVKSPYF